MASIYPNAKQVAERMMEIHDAAKRSRNGDAPALMMHLCEQMAALGAEHAARVCAEFVMRKHANGNYAYGLDRDEIRADILALIEQSKEGDVR